MITNPFLSMHISLICPLPLFYYILVNKRNDTKIKKKYFVLKPKQVYVNVCVKRVYPHKTNNNIRKENFPSHDRACDDRIRHLNNLRSLIVLSTKVNNLPF